MAKLNRCKKCGMLALTTTSRNPDNGRKGFRAWCCGYPTHYAEWAKSYDQAAKNWNKENPQEVPHA